MRRKLMQLRAVVGLAMVLLTSSVPASAQHKPAASIPAADLIEPAALAAGLQQAATPPPLILQVGFRMLYTQAHIPGSEYAGPGNSADGLKVLAARLAKLPKETALVLYCGCCPWTRCPNVTAAYDAVRALGFTHVKVMHVAADFGTDWVDKGYPVATGD